MFHHVENKYPLWPSWLVIIIIATIQCLFSYPRKSKCPRKWFLVLFLVFSRTEIFFSPTFYFFFLGHSEVFSGRFSDFFSVFPRERFWNFEVFFEFWRENFVFFFSGIEFFSQIEFVFFLLGHNFFVKLFSWFLSRSVWKLFGQIVENFLGFQFFFISVEKLNTAICQLHLPDPELNTRNSTQRRHCFNFWCSTRFTSKQVFFLTPERLYISECRGREMAWWTSGMWYFDTFNILYINVCTQAKYGLINIKTSSLKTCLKNINLNN